LLIVFANHTLATADKKPRIAKGSRIIKERCKRAGFYFITRKKKTRLRRVPAARSVGFYGAPPKHALHAATTGFGAVSCRIHEGTNNAGLGWPTEKRIAPPPALSVFHWSVWIGAPIMRKRLSFWDFNSPGDATQFITQANIKSGDHIVLVCRVSGCEQGRRNNHHDQEAALRELVSNCDGIVVGVIRIVISGFNPYWLSRAVALAEEHDAKILAESTDRLIRHPAYHSSECPDAQPSISHLRGLNDWTEGIELLTLLDPNATPKEVRSYQRKRGQRMKGNKGGRPPTPAHVALRRAVLQKLRSTPSG